MKKRKVWPKNCPFKPSERRKAALIEALHGGEGGIRVAPCGALHWGGNGHWAQCSSRLCVIQKDGMMAHGYIRRDRGGR